MIVRPTLRRTLYILAIGAAGPLLVACPKDKKPVVVDSGAPTPAATDAGSPDFLPEDSGAPEDSGIDSGAKKWSGPGTPTNVARLKQCCAQLASQAKSLGASPEGGMIMGAAAQCNTIAAGIGPNGNAPELGVIRTMLKGHTIPAVCAGF